MTVHKRTLQDMVMISMGAPRRLCNGTHPHPGNEHETTLPFFSMERSDRTWIRESPGLGRVGGVEDLIWELGTQARYLGTEINLDINTSRAKLESHAFHVGIIKPGDTSASSHRAA